MTNIMTTTFTISALPESKAKIPNTIKSLVVDDNLITGKILSKILTKEFNHEVTCVSSGNEALNILSQTIYDLVFMDIDMPELSGVETSMKIRNSTNIKEENRIIPIFAYTTNKWEEKFLNAGMNGYIGKPASSGKIQAVIENISRQHLSTAVNTR
ncbi:38202_t:CDS:2 [Gigaspora margarita]|uniref:38202_t:CDS:1 n=2 Tax=Gigaspora margarita TaxID=4874 RepID=A0ABN7UI39_GIGMA|nr:CheY-like protein [Gigaspora margarita]CAG8602448.1 38202_t:CDS:2 [Gigaspora margarita]